MFTKDHGLESLKGEQNWLMMTYLNITVIKEPSLSDFVSCSNEPLTGSNTPETCQKLEPGHKLCSHSDYSFTSAVAALSPALLDLCVQSNLCNQDQECDIVAEEEYICDSEPTDSTFSCEKLSGEKQICQGSLCHSLREDSSFSTLPL